jgi:large subunit ribosomal protein L14e
MFEIGRICVKLAGRDAGMRCIVIDVLDKHNVLIDGETRRRKCNMLHLEPLDKKVEISKNAPAAEVIRVMKELGYEIPEKSARKEKKKEAPTKTKVQKAKPAKAEPKTDKVKKAAKKE